MQSVIERLQDRGFQLSDFADETKNADAFAALVEIAKEHVAEAEAARRESENLSGFPLGLLDKPISIPVVMYGDTEENGEIIQTQHRAIIRLNRAAGSKVVIKAIASLVMREEESYLVLFNRFCDLLHSEPEGIPDFPADERPLKERAIEYFGKPGRGELVQAVMLHYEEMTNPIIDKR